MILRNRVILGYGRFRSAATTEELIEALRGALCGLAPGRGMRGISSLLIVIDTTEKMGQPFGDSSRMGMVVEVLRDNLRSPVFKSDERRFDLAA
jgi:hypothetical protein